MGVPEPMVEYIEPKINSQSVQENQQDALQHTWAGYIADTDGGADWKDEHTDAGYVVGAGQVPEEELAVRVGGPSHS